MARPSSGASGLMQPAISLGRVGGIPVGLHYSWFIIAALITFSLAAQFRGTHPAWAPALTWTVAGLTAVLFFATLLAHELSHALVARARGLPVRSITLFALGGVARIDKDANTSRTEFLVAIVGPVSSAAIGLVCISVARSLGWSMEERGVGIVGSVLGWLGSINLVLAVFNLVPGYPLDGGRVLRAILWAIYKDVDRATRNAARVGQAVALVFIATGLYQFFGGAGFGGLWLAFIGWFLLTAAQASYAQVTIAESLRDLRVADLMASDCVSVDPDADVQTVVDEVLLRTGRRCVMVGRDGNVIGLITPADLRATDRSRWPDLRVREIMRPLESLKTVTPETPATEALSTMAREDVNQLPVVSEGRLKGIISRAQILGVIQARSELAA